MVYLEHSETLSFDDERIPDCQILKGDVRFRHEQALMYCDSAFFNDKHNTIDAFGHVKMVQGDTLFVYGDKLYYDGNTKLARLRKNVKMQNKDMTLYTDSLNYDRVNEIGYYFNGGKIVDSENTLTSIGGKYYSNQNTAVFRHKVVLNNPKFVLHSDTLNYNTSSHVAVILGPSVIDYEDSTHVYSTHGWYNTQNETMQLLDQSYIVDESGHRMSGDTIDYNRHAKKAEAFGHVAMRDSAQSQMITGGYAWLDEADGRGWFTQKATLIDFSNKDSLFLTGDTIFFFDRDSINEIKVYYNVQSWQADFQSVCDSMFYSTADSIMRMYGNPIAWNESAQISGEEMRVHTRNGQVYMTEVEGSAFVFRQELDSAFNQISGKLITGYIDNGHLRKIRVEGNAMSLYCVSQDTEKNWAYSDTSQYIGLNRAESSEMDIYFTPDKKIERIILRPASNGTMYQPDRLDDKSISLLKGFVNQEKYRPADRYDIYNKKDRGSTETTVTKSKRRKR
ncbi:MAG: hypothetical protein J5808_04130 [Paludibacteraceae bacterium]|nr:hypothetical protein [Paludibacteraceae bacterium]